MRVAILGAGFTGLAAALRLAQAGHEVTVFEKEATVGGLAIGFSQIGWDWTIEKAYHHWFTNDNSVLNLAKELNWPVIIKRPSTDVFINGKMVPLDSPLTLLKFSYLPLVDRIRTGLALAYLKFTSDYKSFENKKALNWIKNKMGQRSAQLIWEPLFKGKFGDFKDEISLTWFWARIKKRTPKLAYPEGGFQRFADRLSAEVQKKGGNILLGTTVLEIKNSEELVEVKTDKKVYSFDKVIVTLPSPVFTKVTLGLPEQYVKKINSIPHLHAQVLILTLKKPFFDKTYWLNITSQNFPFLVLAEHTNFMDPKHYGNAHILYVGNYLSSGHKFLKMSGEQLLQEFDPFLKQINSNYKENLINSYLFVAPFAQPVVTTEYSTLIPKFETPLKNIYLANLDIVYPWDRGTNYAVEMGEKIAYEISPQI